MRIFSLFLLALVVQSILHAQSFPVNTIIDNGPDNKRINMVFISDGYTNGQLPQFLNDAGQTATDLFNTTPFKEYRNFFNVHTISVPSAQSGADHPGTATDVAEPAFPVVDINNYFGSTFDYFSIHRLVVPVNSANIYSVLGSNFPAYDQVVVLANSSEYGGSGGTFATTTLHPSASEIAIHEIGHSFGFLSDEYWAGDVYANESANMTRETNPNLVKWADWININDVGIFQHCCGGTSADWYRPHESCKMRFLGVPFCSVCSEALIDRIYSLVTPINRYFPTAANLDFNGSPINFSLDLILPQPNTLYVVWELNGAPIAEGTQAVTLQSADLQTGVNTLVARVIDETPLSKSYFPNSGYEFTREWTINKMDGACMAGGNRQGNGPGQEVIPSGVYHYSGTVTLANYRVAANADVTLRAETRITLKPPFKVGPNADFTAQIAACSAAAPDDTPLAAAQPTTIPGTLYAPASARKTIGLKIYPNPAGSNLTLRLRLPEMEAVALDLLDLSGKRLLSILDQTYLEEGMHQFAQDLGDMPAGMYFIRLTSQTQQLMTKLVVE